MKVMTSYVMTKENVSRKIADEAVRLFDNGTEYEEAVRMAKEESERVLSQKAAKDYLK